MPIADNLTLNEIIDTGRDFLPVVSTIDSGKRWVNSGYAFEPGVEFALNLGSDLLLPFGVGGIWRGVATMPKIARTAKALDRTVKTGKRFANGAKEALAVRNTARAKRLNKGAKAASKKVENLTVELEDLKDIRNVGFGSAAVVLPAGTYKQIAHGIKKDSSKKNSVEKRTEPYLYNTFKKKNGGTMKRLIPRHYEGSTVDRVIDAGGYLVPFYGTYKSYKDWEKNKTWENALMTGISGLGDALLVFGVGEGLKAIPAAKAAARMTKAADALESGAKATREAAGLARNSGNIGLAEKLESKAFDQSVRASDKAFEALLLSSRAKNYKGLVTYSAEGSTYTKAGLGPRGSQSSKNYKKLNLVEKRSSSLASTYYPKFK